jgi:DNA-directed RNA polymerase specialized sigma24 family protein
MLAHYFDGDSCEEIAERDGVGVATITTHLTRARDMVRNRLGIECRIPALSAA